MILVQKVLICFIEIFVWRVLFIAKFKKLKAGNDHTISEKMGNEIHREILKLILKHSASFARQILV
jgi:hypothetical protein